MHSTRWTHQLSIRPLSRWNTVRVTAGVKERHRGNGEDRGQDYFGKVVVVAREHLLARVALPKAAELSQALNLTRTMGRP